MDLALKLALLESDSVADSLTLRSFDIAEISARWNRCVRAFVLLGSVDAARFTLRLVSLDAIEECNSQFIVYVTMLMR